MWKLEKPQESKNLIDELLVVEGKVKDYERLAHFHYISESKPYIIKIFKLIHEDYNYPLGVIVYSPSPLNSKLRNRLYYGKRINAIKDKKKRFRYLNKKLITISRVIIHPSLRGIGAAKKLVYESGLRVNKQIIEITAEMLVYYPFLPSVFKFGGISKVEIAPQEYYLIKQNKISKFYSSAEGKNYNKRVKLVKYVALYYWDKKQTGHWP